MVNGLTIRRMGKAYSITLMVMFIRANSSMIRLTVTVSTVTRRDQDMKVTGKTISKTDLVKNSGLMALFMKAPSNKE